MNIVVSHETRRVAAFKPKARAKPKPALASPIAGEADALSDLLATTLLFCRPASAAALGISAAGLNLNLLYRDDAGQRYPSKFLLELGQTDLTEDVVRIEPVDLVHAALVLEQATETKRCLANLLSLVAMNGTLSVVLELTPRFGGNKFEGTVSRGQAPSTGISPSARAQHGFVSPIWIAEALAQYGFRLSYQKERAVSSGKVFWLGIFERSWY